MEVKRRDDGYLEIKKHIRFTDSARETLINHIKQRCVYGELGSPRREPNQTSKEFIYRLNSIDENRMALLIERIWFGVDEITLIAKPWGVFGDMVRDLKIEEFSVSARGIVDVKDTDLWHRIVAFDIVPAVDKQFVELVDLSGLNLEGVRYLPAFESIGQDKLPVQMNGVDILSLYPPRPEKPHSGLKDIGPYGQRLEPLNIPEEAPEELKQSPLSGPPDQQALQNVINRLMPIVKKIGLEVDTHVVFAGESEDYPIVVGDLRLLAAIHQMGMDILGMSNPHLRRNVTLSICLNEEGRYDFNLTLAPLYLESADTTSVHGSEHLIQAVELLMQESYVDFHADGRITGAGMGHHLARALRKSQPGDEIHHLLNHPEVEKPIRLVLEGAAWSWQSGIEPDVTRH